MAGIAQVVFWAALALCAYTYGGYLLLLVLTDAWAGLRSTARWLASGTERRTGAAAALPRVSVLVAAHNEQAVIRQKLENTLALDYPADRLQVLVGSDGSTDATEDVVREFAGRGVVLSAAPRQGKAQVLNRLARLADGEVFLFTDANTELRPDALRLLVRHFADPRTGAACGRLVLRGPDGAPREEGLYWRYENLLKFYESKRGVLMGANGGLYALRRRLWHALPPGTIVDDFLVAMRVVRDGGRVLYDPEACAYEETAADLEGEFRRRVRIAAGNFQSLRELRPLLRRASFAGLAFWSHKVLRWCVPALLPLLLVASAVLAARPLYLGFLVAQALFYAAALVGQRGPGPLRRATALARYFTEMNGALALGFLRHLRRAQPPTWQRTDRAPANRAA